MSQDNHFPSPVRCTRPPRAQGSPCVVWLQEFISVILRSQMYRRIRVIPLLLFRRLGRRSPKHPRTTTLHGDDDIPIDRIDARRREAGSLLTNSRHRSLFSCFGMPGHMATEPGLLQKQYDFDDRGNEIICRRILQELMATDETCRAGRKDRSAKVINFAGAMT